MTAINLFPSTRLLSQLSTKVVLTYLVITCLSSLQAAVQFKSLNANSNAKNKNSTSSIQGGLLLGKTLATNKVLLDNKPIRLATDGSFIIGFGRSAKDAELRIITDTGIEKTQAINVLTRQYKIDRIDGLPPAKVNPKGKAVLKRIKVESTLVKNARKTDHPRQDFKAGFIWPSKGRISGVYGSQRILNGQPKWPHYGLDIAAPVGADVIAPASGVVTLVHLDMYYSGGTLILDHGQGLSSTFLHLSEILVKPGQTIERGELLAKVGATGRATGPHLDWRINWFSIRLDPQLLVDGLSQDAR